MPSRKTRNSHRPRASDRTMVASDAPDLLAALSNPSASVTSSRETHEHGQQTKLLQRSKPESGLDLEKESRLRSRRRFFLDIPFYRTSMNVRIVDWQSDTSLPFVFQRVHGREPPVSPGRWVTTTPSNLDPIEAIDGCSVNASKDGA